MGKGIKPLNEKRLKHDLNNLNKLQQDLEEHKRIFESEKQKIQNRIEQYFKATGSIVYPADISLHFEEDHIHDIEELQKVIRFNGEIGVRNVYIPLQQEVKKL